MKKVLVIVMVAISSTVFAIDPSSYKVIYKLNNETTFNGLIHYLNADESQANQLKQIFEVTENRMKTALKLNSENEVEDVLFYNALNAKCILTEEQYKKYLTVLNLTVSNNYQELLTQK